MFYKNNFIGFRLFDADVKYPALSSGWVSAGAYSLLQSCSLFPTFGKCYSSYLVYYAI